MRVEYINKNCSYYSIPKGDLYPEAELALLLYDQIWSSWSSLQGWENEGIWRENSDGNDITVVEGTLNEFTAVGDKYGIIRLYESPVIGKYPPYVKSIMHSGQIAAIKFVNKKSMEEFEIFSIGLDDLAIVQYKIELFSNEEALKTVAHVETRNVFNIKNYKEINYKFKSNRHHSNFIPNLWPKDYKDDVLKNILDVNNKLPETDFIVRESIGVEFNKMKQGVKYSGKDGIVFISGNMVVVFNNKKKTKSFFIQHKKRISALAECRVSFGFDKTSIVATAETLDTPDEVAEILVWCSDTKEIFAEIKHLKGFIVETMVFHPDKTRLVMISFNGTYYRLSIYNWIINKIVFSENLGKYRINDIKFKDFNECLTVGVKHIRWFDLCGNHMVSHNADWGNIPREDLKCCEYCFTKRICFTGSSSGNIGTWVGKKLVLNIPAHAGEIIVLSGFKDKLFSGGIDGKVKSWIFSQGQLTLERELVLLSEFLKTVCWPVSIDVKFDKSMLIASSKGHIVEIMPDKGLSYLIDEPTNEIFDFTIDDEKNILVLVSDDSSIRKWDLKENKLLSIEKFISNITAIDILKENNEVCYICANKNKEIFKIDENFKEKNISLLSKFKSNEIIRILKVSPSREYVTIAAENSIPKIEIFRTGGVNGRLVLETTVPISFSGTISNFDYSGFNQKMADKMMAKRAFSKNASMLSAHSSQNVNITA